MNVFRLLEFAADRLTTNDALFHEQADTVLGILTISRCACHTSVHRSTAASTSCVAAMIVQAYDTDTTIDVAVACG